VQQLLAALGDVEDDRIPPLAPEALQALVAQLRAARGQDRRPRPASGGAAPTEAICPSPVEVPGVGPVIATALNRHHARYRPPAAERRRSRAARATFEVMA
jgi:hypothetical protein